jgi:hypothetical protein
VAAGIGIGLVGDWDDIHALVHLGPAIEPAPPHDAYEEGYAMYRSLADTLRPTLHALAGRSRAVEATS